MRHANVTESPFSLSGPGDDRGRRIVLNFHDLAAVLVFGVE